MSQPKTYQTKENQENFENVSLDKLGEKFDEKFQVSKSTASQVVLGFRYMSAKLADSNNEYQRLLYPKMKELCDRIVTEYSKVFLTDFSSDVQRRVYGHNLNGGRNNGYRSHNVGSSRRVRYSNAHFGYLLRILYSRLNFVVRQDPEKMRRHNENSEYCDAYKQLQRSATQFFELLNSIKEEWEKAVNDIRKVTGVTVKEHTDTGKNRRQGPQTLRKDNTRTATDKTEKTVRSKKDKIVQLLRRNISKQ